MKVKEEITIKLTVNYLSTLKGETKLDFFGLKQSYALSASVDGEIKVGDTTFPITHAMLSELEFRDSKLFAMLMAFRKQEHLKPYRGLVSFENE